MQAQRHAQRAQFAQVQAHATQLAQVQVQAQVQANTQRPQELHSQAAMMIDTNALFGED
jgi:hypothetical protein